jgi:hypothetical protein
LQDSFNALVNFVACAVNQELGLGANRQKLNVGWEIALVRSPDQILPQTERAQDFGGASDQRDYAQLLGHMLSAAFVKLA